MHRHKKLAGGALVAIGALLAGCGSDGGSSQSQHFSNPTGTTLERAYILSSFLLDPHSVGPYSKLTVQPGYPLAVRTDLGAPAFESRFGRRRHLVSFIQMTDIHIIDAQSPLRSPFLRKYNDDPSLQALAATGMDIPATFRAQDQLTYFVAEAMVVQANRLGRGPVMGEPFSFAISTGDNADGEQVNELQNCINLLDGAEVTANTSTQGYVGVQDDFIPPAEPGSYDQYWHPDPPPPGVGPDVFKRRFNYPEYPGLLQSATENFQATGLSYPWYTAFGNHDGLLQGNLALTDTSREFLDLVATGKVPGFGSVMFLDIPPQWKPIDYLECMFSPTPECLAKIIAESPKREIPASEDRRTFTKGDFIDMHLESPSLPRGHGFSELNRTLGILYYTFHLAEGIKGIVLDTVVPGGGANGSIGALQFEFLLAELCLAQKTSCPAQCKINLEGITVDVCKEAKDELIVLFSHHSLQTMNNARPVEGSKNPDDLIRVLAPDIEKLLLLFPNMVLWVDGHSHVNRIVPHPDPTGLSNGFWEVNTASHIDYPQQSRTIEMVDNQDGTLSIFAVLFDHAGPLESTTSQAPFDHLDLAAISRELSANDPLIGGLFDAFRLGSTQHRNVELLIDKPIFADGG